MSKKTSNYNINLNSTNNTSSINTNNYNNFDQNICSKCNKNFATTQTLKTHLLTSNCDKKNVPIIHKCDFCDKEFSSKQMLNYHNNVCIDRKISILKTNYENKIKELEEKLENLKEKNE